MTAPERRPAYPKGTKELVKAKGRPPGFETTSCCFCGATVLDSEFAIHHDVPWAVIKEYASHDYDLQILSPEEVNEAMAYLHAYPDNLLPAHSSCNASDGKITRDYEAHRRHLARMKSNPDWAGLG